MGFCRVAMALFFLLMGGFGAFSQQDSSNTTGHFATFQELLRQRHIELTKPALMDALRNSDPHVRYLAALTLAEDKATDTIPAITDALTSEKVPETRANIAFALAQIGEEKGFATLKSMCVDRDVPAYLRIYATGYLLDLGDENCLNAVFDVLQSGGSFGTRVSALSLLPRFQHVSEDDSRRIVGATLKALVDTSPALRIAASDTLARLGTVAAIPSLESSIAKERNEAVRSQMQTDLQSLREKKEH